MKRITYVFAITIVLYSAVQVMALVSPTPEVALQVLELRRKLHAQTMEARLTAAYQLGKLGPAAAPAIPELINLFHDFAKEHHWDHNPDRNVFPGQEVIPAAVPAWALARIGTAAVEPLIAHLALDELYPEDYNWGYISQALGEIGDPRAIAPLKAALANRSLPGAWVSRWGALGKLEGHDELTSLIEAMRQPELPIRTRAAKRLCELCRGNDFYKYLQSLATERKRQTAKAFFEIYMANKAYQQSDSRLRGLLYEIMHEDWIKDLMSMEFVKALRQGDSRADDYFKYAQPGDEMLALMLNGLSGMKVDYRRKVARILGDYGGWEKYRAQVGGALAGLLTDQDPEICQLACASLSHTKYPSAIPALALLLNDPNLQIRRNAAIALANLGDGRGIDLLLAALQDPDRKIKMRVMGALGTLRDPRAVEPLIAILNQSGDEMAMDALARIGDPRALEPLLKQLTRSAHGYNRFAVYALGTLGDRRAVEPLCKLFTSLPTDEEPRSPVVMALGAIGDPAALPLLRKELAAQPPLQEGEPLHLNYIARYRFRIEDAIRKIEAKAKGK